jgi:hypothetical protein
VLDGLPQSRTERAVVQTEFRDGLRVVADQFDERHRVAADDVVRSGRAMLHG